MMFSQSKKHPTSALPNKYHSMYNMSIPIALFSAVPPNAHHLLAINSSLIFPLVPAVNGKRDGLNTRIYTAKSQFRFVNSFMQQGSLYTENRVLNLVSDILSNPQELAGGWGENCFYK